MSLSFCSFSYINFGNSRTFLIIFRRMLTFHHLLFITNTVFVVYFKNFIFFFLILKALLIAQKLNVYKENSFPNFFLFKASLNVLLALKYMQFITFKLWQHNYSMKNNTKIFFVIQIILIPLKILHFHKQELLFLNFIMKVFIHLISKFFKILLFLFFKFYNFSSFIRDLYHQILMREIMQFHYSNLFLIYSFKYQNQNDLLVPIQELSFRMDCSLTLLSWFFLTESFSYGLVYFP